MPDERCDCKKRMSQYKGLEPKFTRAYLGLGSNLGDREHNLSKAIQLLSRRTYVECVSSFYETEPVGYLEQPRFLNAVCEVITSLPPEGLLALAKKMEETLGRTPGFRNGPRSIDIDVLFYGDQVINCPQLVVPHPRIEERAFVLVPLAEIAPGLVHPVSRRTMRELVEKVEGLGGVKKYKQESKDV